MMPMVLRYMGFDQQRNIREYKFDGFVQGETTQHIVITADLALFLLHRVGIQEGPALCMRKLLAATSQEGLVLDNDDLLAYVAARTLADARKPSRRNAAAALKAEAAVEQ